MAQVIGVSAPRLHEIVSPAREISLTDLLDRVLNKGVVLSGEIVISVAGVGLIYIGVNALLSSVETLLAQQDGGSGVGAGSKV